MTDDVMRLEDRLGYLLKTAYRQLAERIDTALASFGLTARQLAVLSVIGREAAPSQIALSERLGVDRTTIVAMLDLLETRGWVERRRDPHDRRRNVLVLTEAGETLVAGAEKARAAAEAEYLSRIGDRDADRLLRSLQSMTTAAPSSSPESDSTW